MYIDCFSPARVIAGSASVCHLSWSMADCLYALGQADLGMFLQEFRMHACSFTAAILKAAMFWQGSVLLIHRFNGISAPGAICDYRVNCIDSMHLIMITLVLTMDIDLTARSSTRGHYMLCTDLRYIITYYSSIFKAQYETVFHTIRATCIKGTSKSTSMTYITFNDLHSVQSTVWP
jgi:hypothetical protein